MPIATRRGVLTFLGTGPGGLPLQQARRRRPRRIHVSRPLALWGADLTLVFVLGFLPVWVLGVVD